LDEGITSHHKAIVLNPNLPEAHYNLGITLRSLGRLDEAIASYREALTRNPDYAEAHSNLGNSLKELGRLEEAFACLSRGYKSRYQLRRGAHQPRQYAPRPGEPK
jgi:tetratricopeptide (TPR) repeat protein